MRGVEVDLELRRPADGEGEPVEGLEMAPDGGVDLPITPDDVPSEG